MERAGEDVRSEQTEESSGGFPGQSESQSGQRHAGGSQVSVPGAQGLLVLSGQGDGH